MDFATIITSMTEFFQKVVEVFGVDQEMILGLLKSAFTFQVTILKQLIELFIAA